MVSAKTCYTHHEELCLAFITCLLGTPSPYPYGQIRVAFVIVYRIPPIVKFTKSWYLGTKCRIYTKDILTKARILETRKTYSRIERLLTSETSRSHAQAAQTITWRITYLTFFPTMVYIGRNYYLPTFNFGLNPKIFLSWRMGKELHNQDGRVAVPVEEWDWIHLKRTTQS